MNGEEIKALRKKLGMNQSDFAKAFGVSFSTISRWEKAYKVYTPNDIQVEQLKALEALAKKTIDYSLIRLMLTVGGIGGAIALAVCGGIRLPCTIAVTMDAIVNSIRISNKIKYREGVFMNQVDQVVAKIVDKNNQVVDVITENALLEAARDSKNFDDSGIEAYTVNDLGEIDSEFGSDHSTGYVGRIELVVTSEKGEEYRISQDINNTDDVVVETIDEELTAENIDMTYNLSELHEDSQDDEDI